MNISVTERLKLFIDKLNKENILVIVEGKKDKLALNCLGIKRIKAIKGPLFKFCEEISAIAKEVVILTDFDKEGKKLYARLKSMLQANGIKIYDKVRMVFMKELRISHIEGLADSWRI